ncbi:MAG: mycothiol synthase [Mycobacteriales bacterium]
MEAPHVEVVAAPSDEQVAGVLQLRDEVAVAAGVSPLSDQVVSTLRARINGQHFLQTAAGRLVGYAHLEPAERDPVAELLVGPDGDAAGLLDAVSAASPTARIWTRGDAAPLNDVLPKQGYGLTRTLLQLRRPLDEPALDEPVWPAGVTVHSFVVGTDEAAWLEVNNAAFEGHPEQSGWTLADVTAREHEPWFDPAGFFLADLDGRIVGFHWTKQHSDDLGEVYVIGVDPSMQGRRLGEALLLHGLRHLQAAGLETVMLYVESDNHGALALYDRLGFTKWDADRMFSRSG